jgi:CDP-4-dehydro-6-deoxyglucose reductase
MAKLLPLPHLFIASAPAARCHAVGKSVSSAAFRSVRILTPTSREIRLASGIAFPAGAHETILDAAARAGIALPHSCRIGRCRACRARVRAGRTHASCDEGSLEESERSAGWVLTCVRTAESDLELEIEALSAEGLPAPRIVPCRIADLARLTDTVLRVTLRLPPDSAFDFRPGQHVEIIGPGGQRRSYSLANAPRPDGRLQLLVRRVDGGLMSRYWFDEARVGDLLRLNGPLGTFFLRGVAQRHVAFLATGTGIAPVQAMCEGLDRMPTDARPTSVLVCWGERSPTDLHWVPGASAVPIEFLPVLSRADASWTGARGYAQEAVERRLNRTPDGWTVYACGSEAMITDARARCRRAGVPDHHFHADPFVAYSPPATATPSGAPHA